MPNRVEVLFNFKTTKQPSIISFTTTIAVNPKNPNLSRQIDTTTNNNTTHHYSHRQQSPHQIGNNIHRFIHQRKRQNESKSKKQRQGQQQQRSSVPLLLFLIIIIVTMILGEHQSIAHSSQPLLLPCNITPPTSDDDVSLILWYRDDLSTPIYTVDARGMSNLNVAKHFQDHQVLTDRVTFNITYPISYLRFKTVIESDTAEYRCRVDFRRDRTINRVMQLNVIVPAKRLSIYDMKNNYINDIAGPFNEDSPLNLTCESEGGHPLPKVKWWNGDEMISDHNINPQKGLVRNVIHFNKILRKHLMMPLTCESSNTNLTVPVTKTILIDLNLKPTEVIIVRPLHNMTVGQRVELVCQSSGSRPPAKISWKKNNKPMEHYSESTSDDGSVTTNFLAFTPTIEDDGKWLSCMASNPQFKDFHLEDKLKLNIHYAPILSLLLGANAKQQEIVENSSVYFDCDIQANPPVQEFGWLFNGDELKTTPTTLSNNAKVVDTNYNHGAQDNVTNQTGIEIRNNSIIIKKVNLDHIGAYQCYAGNPLGKTFSEIVNLHVKYAPICANEQTIHYRIQLFERLTIKCDVRADPKDVMFFWEFNSSTIDNYDNDPDTDDTDPEHQSIRTTKGEKPLMAIENDGDTSVIHFTPRSIDDYGTLYCFAQNRIGRQRKPCIFQISKSETPEAPLNCSLMNVSMKSITVQCKNVTNYDKKDHLEQQSHENHSQKLKFVLLIYDGLNRLIQNVTSLDNPHFRVDNIDLNDFDNMNLYVYSTNQNGQSDKTRVQANNLVGQPRKLEHIEQRINVKPFLLLMFVAACLITSIGAFILTLVYRIRSRRRRTKNLKQAKNEENNNGNNGNQTSQQQRYDCTVFDNEIQPTKESSSLRNPIVVIENGTLEPGLEVNSDAYSSMNKGEDIEPLGSTAMIMDSIESDDHDHDTNRTIISLDDFTVGQQGQQIQNSCHHHNSLPRHHHHHHCKIATNILNQEQASTNFKTRTLPKNTRNGDYLELTNMNQSIEMVEKDFGNVVSILTPQSSSSVDHLHDRHFHSPKHPNHHHHHHHHHHHQSHVKICNNSEHNADDPNLNHIVSGELIFSVPSNCNDMTPTPPSASLSSSTNDPDNMNNGTLLKWNIEPKQQPHHHHQHPPNNGQTLMNNELYLAAASGSSTFPCIIVADNPNNQISMDARNGTLNNNYAGIAEDIGIGMDFIEATTSNIVLRPTSMMMKMATTSAANNDDLTLTTEMVRLGMSTSSMVDRQSESNDRNLSLLSNRNAATTAANNANNNQINIVKQSNNQQNLIDKHQQHQQLAKVIEITNSMAMPNALSTSPIHQQSPVKQTAAASSSSSTQPPPLPPKSAIKVRFVE